MDRIRIRGGRPLQGRIQISGAKNAALPLMAASLLTDKTLSLSNLPALADIATMGKLLEQHGVDLRIEGENAARKGHLTAARITNTTAPYDLVRKMRASVLVLGPILARCGEARVSLPGGCAIGNRPVDLHVKGLTALGAEISLEEGYIHATAPKGLKGNRFVFPQVSVGATENILMAACLAEGETTLVNAAREPEVNDLAHCLNAMGAKIEGIGTDTLKIQGVAALHGAEHRVVADRIEAGTFAIGAVMTDGELELTGICPTLLESLLKLLGEGGAKIEPMQDGFRIRRANGSMDGVDVMTEPYPGFPTDLQAQIMALMTVSKGAAMITETIFENRFMHVPELCRMGANINVHHSSAMIRGVEKLRGAPVMATDLRASVSMVLAGLVADGETIVNRVYHLDRGYERLEEKLAACGADIARIAGE
ncbi:UDP-N-acetylglucosamine 1-carboxyvinyltransferase [Oceanibaculum indicum]|uniref:UDP-N-acetylglucosamine 1-carboxyvinyltransferase n=1 Tax=Oceanibaculum indicum P24 TaxID=1207063 RepID=K2KLG4_9PROT|nr:UDP-N-acetylglucosamine 1-carboxyvinyltransferase [Oceanibaculum indicum]EKE78240.1 UDP-N-acetylglucosamine 1-carboxyvinyltransferase [Oceanibaculum indicum P24]